MSDGVQTMGTKSFSWVGRNSTDLCKCFKEDTHQDEVSLICGEHEDGNVLLGKWSDDRLGNLCHTDSLRAARGVAVGGNIEGQPDGALDLEVL